MLRHRLRNPPSACYVARTSEETPSPTNHALSSHFSTPEHACSRLGEWRGNLWSTHGWPAGHKEEPKTTGKDPEAARALVGPSCASSVAGNCIANSDCHLFDSHGGSVGTTRCFRWIADSPAASAWAPSSYWVTMNFSALGNFD